MTAFLLYNSVTCETGRALALALGIPGGEHLPEQRFDRVIRFGNREKVRYKPNKTLNKRESLDLSANKARAFQHMEDNEIPHPKVVDRFDGKLLYARKPQHAGGNGMLLCMSQLDVDRARSCGYNHFLEAVACANEYRFHVWKDEILFCYERVLPDNPEHLHVRNMWDERKIDNPPREGCELTIKTLKAFDLDFAGIDIIKSISGKWYVLELNSGIGLMNGERKKPSFAVYETVMRRWLDVE